MGPDHDPIATRLGRGSYGPCTGQKLGPLPMRLHPSAWNLDPMLYQQCLEYNLIHDQVASGRLSIAPGETGITLQLRYTPYASRLRWAAKDA